ncbi:MAG TPA: YeeE/YedE family protein [Trueperaceae bacterium]|nr:YeeE/YedE family protein [Trueperaceae bacterium]
MNNKLEYVLGFLLVFVAIYLGITQLKESILFFRLIVGTGFGYALARAVIGFSGSVGRPFRTGSTRLMQVLVMMFVGTAILSVSLLYNADLSQFHLRIYPISIGAIAGGLLFGFGMAMTGCCASGALTTLASSLPRAAITLFFFMMGVFVGFPVQKNAAWVKNSLISTATGRTQKGGVFFPDLFKWDGVEGYLGAVLLSILLAGIVIYFAKIYESRQRAAGNFKGIAIEKEQSNCPEDEENFSLFSERTYYQWFVKPWSMSTGAFVIMAMFLMLLSVTHKGWGITTSFGYWFGKIILLFGSSPEALADFTGKKVSAFTTPFFEHASSIQNFGILLGVVIYYLTAGKLMKSLSSGWNLKLSDILMYVFGGFFMGFGTRLANGCNVGALYSPIATFSLSGWIFLATMTAGAIVGNIVARRINPSCAIC